jgi:hypothetical protein
MVTEVLLTFPLGIISDLQHECIHSIQYTPKEMYMALQGSNSLLEARDSNNWLLTEKSFKLLHISRETKTEDITPKTQNTKETKKAEESSINHAKCITSTPNTKRRQRD